MIDFHLSQEECLILRNALRAYINAGVMVAEDEVLATDLLRELNTD